MDLRNTINRMRNRVVNRTTGLFAHAPYPLTNTLDHMGDPGLFGPDSATWPIIGDAAAFIGGVRALVIQAAHPEVAAGVADHSRYRQDPLGRLSRTSAYVTATAFGAMPEVERAVSMVRGRHRPVAGTSHRGRTYTAATPVYAAWVHNALTDSFLVAFQVFGPRHRDEVNADQFVAEQTRVGALLDAAPLPATADGLAAWVAEHPDAGPSPAMESALEFLTSPPLPRAVKLGYRMMYWAAVATIPRRLRGVLGLRRVPGAIVTGRILVGFLRWALGSSPSWHVALVRAGAPVPDGLFNQPLLAPAKRATAV
ncbi:MAG TPA: oxygenase MpaB family protein [Acidimicrobiia bacterium]|jgi:uncharacterized protein (DUF2236 family)|nr:oxygenase MpaB family protein [Acidimicrobiia bacterium]